MEESINDLFIQMKTLVQSGLPKESLVQEIEAFRWKVLCLWAVYQPVVNTCLTQLLPKDLSDALTLA